MTSVTQITQFLYHRDPQQSLGRLALYHYLKNACETGNEFNLKLLRRFIDQCFQFQMWQQKAPQLIRDIVQVLSELRSEKLVEWADNDLKWLTNYQLLRVASPEERLRVLERYLTSTKQSESQKIIPLENERLLCIQLLSTGGLRVKEFSSLAKIEDGSLLPLGPLSQLEYTSYMELMPGQLQTLNLDGIRSAVFSSSDEGYYGRVVHGHLYKASGTIQTVDLSAFQDIYYALKAIEQHFIDPSSDPFYQELVNQLEKVYHLLSSQHPEGYKIAPTLLKKGQSALRNIFHKDKLLLLLVNNIEYMLNKSEQTHERSDYQWQNARPLPR